MGCGGSKRLYPEGEGIPEKLRPLLRRRYEQIMRRRGIHKPPKATTTLSQKQLLDDNHVSDADSNAEETDPRIKENDKPRDLCDYKGHNHDDVTPMQDEESAFLLSSEPIGPRDSSAVSFEEPQHGVGNDSKEDDKAINKNGEGTSKMTLFDSFSDKPNPVKQVSKDVPKTQQEEESALINSFNPFFEEPFTASEVSENVATIRQGDEPAILLSSETIGQLDSSAVICDSNEYDAAIMEGEESSLLLKTETDTHSDSLTDEPYKNEEVSNDVATIQVDDESALLSTAECYSSDTAEEESDDEENGTVSFSRGSPSFRVYLPSMSSEYQDDDDEIVESLGNTSVASDVEVIEYCTRETCEGGEAIVKVNEGDTSGITKKKWKKTMKLKKVFPMGTTKNVKNLLNVSSCYYPSCSSCKSAPPAPKVLS